MKQILSSKILRKLLTLSCLSIGLIVAFGYRQTVSAASTDCDQERSWCYGAAYDSRDSCYNQCSGIIACEAVCDGKFSDAVTQCEDEYATCVGS